MQTFRRMPFRPLDPFQTANHRLAKYGFKMWAPAYVSNAAGGGEEGKRSGRGKKEGRGQKGGEGAEVGGEGAKRRGGG